VNDQLFPKLSAAATQPREKKSGWMVLFNALLSSEDKSGRKRPFRTANFLNGKIYHSSRIKECFGWKERTTPSAENG
jgi:hypothetical protein